MRRVTIFDDHTGLEISLTFDNARSDGTVITSLTLSTPDGSGVRSEHLRQLEEFGLHMPRTKTSRAGSAHAALSTSEGVTKSTDGDDEAVPGQSASSSPSTRVKPRKRPPDDELRSAWARSRQSPQRLAQMYGVKTKTASNWVYVARQHGILPAAPMSDSERARLTATRRPNATVNSAALFTATPAE